MYLEDNHSFVQIFNRQLVQKGKEKKNRGFFNDNGTEIKSK